MEIENKSIEELDGAISEDLSCTSYVVSKSYNLRKKKIKEFEFEDLRFMISQNIGLQYLIPKAVSVIKKNIFAEGDYYEGDLLYSIITSEKKFWKHENELFHEVLYILKDFSLQINEVCLSDKLRTKLQEAVNQFENYSEGTESEFFSD